EGGGVVGSVVRRGAGDRLRRLVGDVVGDVMRRIGRVRGGGRASALALGTAARGEGGAGEGNAPRLVEQPLAEEWRHLDRRAGEGDAAGPAAITGADLDPVGAPFNGLVDQGGAAGGDLLGPLGVGVELVAVLILDYLGL